MLALWHPQFDVLGPKVNGVKTGRRTMAGYLIASLKKSLGPSVAKRETTAIRSCGMKRNVVNSG